MLLICLSVYFVYFVCLFVCLFLELETLFTAITSPEEEKEKVDETRSLKPVGFALASLNKTAEDGDGNVGKPKRQNEKD